MDKIKYILAAAVFFAASFAHGYDFRRADSFDDAYDLSCRVNVSNARGSGSFIGYDSGTGSALILTNYHVVTTNKTAVVEFWNAGRPVSLNASVVWRYYDAQMPADFAILAVDAQKVAALGLPYIALAGPEVRPSSSAFFVSAGCPKGSHVWAWKGEFLQSAQTAEFMPAPYPGQSGSGLFEFRDGALWYVATLTWLVGPEGSDSSKGAAIPVSNLYKALKNNRFPASWSESTDGGGFVAPANYTEVAEPLRYTVTEYTQDACKPCADALADVAKLQAVGVVVDTIATDKGDGAEIAARDGVTSTPTFVLKNSAGVIVKKWTGAGCAPLVLAAIAQYFPAIEPEATPEKKDADALALTDEFLNEPPTCEIKPEQKPDPAPEKKETAPKSSPIWRAPAVEDFRTRPAVREDFGAVGFFDDAETRWRLRNGGQTSPAQPSEPKEEPEQSAPNRPKLFKNDGEGIDESGLGDRLGAKLAEKLQPLTESIKADIKRELAETVDEYKAEGLTMWTKFKRALICWAFGLIVAAVLLADFIKKAAAKVYAFALDYLRASAAALAASEKKGEQ